MHSPLFDIYAESATTISAPTFYTQLFVIWDNWEGQVLFLIEETQ